MTAHEETQTWLAWNYGREYAGSAWDIDQRAATQGYLDAQWYAWNKAHCDQYRTVDRAAEAELRKQYAAEEEKRKLAAARAEELLFHFLTDEQRRQYLELGYFDTQVNDKRVRLHKRVSGNIHVLTADGKTDYRLCRHIAQHSGIPIADVLLAQLLEMRADFAAFERGANRS